MNRPSGSTSKRADMVISVHPLCQDIPLKILKDLDGGVTRTTPFVTVVTDLAPKAAARWAATSPPMPAARRWCATAMRAICAWGLRWSRRRANCGRA